MAITRWQPFGGELERWGSFREMENLRREMDRLFERLIPGGNGGVGALAFMPSAEMEETDDEVHLKLEVPGLRAKDLDVEVTEDSVAIRGERKSETKTEEKGLLRSEFHYGKFERVIPLSTHIQSDKAKAEYKNGILMLTLPKVEGEKRKTVKINVG
jgi:HSP20 family protein